MWIKVWNANKKFVGILFVASEKELEMASKIYPNWEYSIWVKKELGMPYTQIIHLALIEFIKNRKA